MIWCSKNNKSVIFDLVKTAGPAGNKSICTHISPGEGGVCLVCRILPEVVEELAEDSPAQQEGGGGVAEGGHQGEGHLLGGE